MIVLGVSCLETFTSDPFHASQMARSVAENSVFDIVQAVSSADIANTVADLISVFAVGICRPPSFILGSVAAPYGPHGDDGHQGGSYGRHGASQL